MLQKFKDYTKCAIKNKLVMGSYLGIGLACFIQYIEHETGTNIPVVDNVLILSSFSTLWATQFGTETCEAYRKMRDHIEKHGTIDKRFKDRFSSMYCTQVGIKTAAKEAGLENLI